LEEVDETFGRVQRFVVINVSKTVARHVRVRFTVKGESVTPLNPTDAVSKLPIAELGPGEECPLLGSFGSDPHRVTLTWTDDGCRAGESRTLVKNLYP
jgi:hypothetical protein